MKKGLIILGLVIFAISSVQAQGIKIGAGAYGGVNIPVVQQDQSMGTAFGLRARVSFLPILVAEPNVMFGKWGKPGEVEGVDLGIDGSKVTSYGIDVAIGAGPGKVGFKPFGFVGAGIYSIKNDDTGYDESKLGFDVGLGFMIGMVPYLDIDVRGTAIIAPQEAGSKKAIVVTGGLTYYFGIGM